MNLPRRAPPPPSAAVAAMAAQHRAPAVAPTVGSVDGTKPSPLGGASVEGLRDASSSLDSTFSEVAAPHVFLPEDDGPDLNGYLWPDMLRAPTRPLQRPAV